ncbi:MAG: 2Fe-2S iron-sulfur cluster-binding protein, partial [Desulfobacteraceae bacterium]
QEAFVARGGIQCGFCSPGMIMSATALLQENPSPEDEEIKRGISGNLCRCTGYVQIIESIQEAALRMQKEAD